MRSCYNTRLMKGAVLNFTRWGLLAVVALAGWVHYRGMLSWVVGQIGDSSGDMAYAWVIMIVSLFAVCVQCGELGKAAGLPSWRGFGWACLFLALAWLGAWGGYNRVSQVSAIGLIWAVPYAFWGRGIGRLMLFPAWFLLFTVPLAIDDVVFCLRMFSADAVAAVLNEMGLTVVRFDTALLSFMPGVEFLRMDVSPFGDVRLLVTAAEGGTVLFSPDVEVARTVAGLHSVVHPLGTMAEAGVVVRSSS